MTDPKVTGYLDFLAFCLHPEGAVPECAKVINWNELLSFARKQSIVGIYWEGVRRLENIEENKPTEDDVMVWMGEAVKLKRQGIKLDEKTAEITNMFIQDGYDYCILKGQTNNRFYPSPYSRTPGDIDIWVEGGRKKLLNYVLDKVGTTEVLYHHLEYPIFKDVPVEVHNTPIFSANPFKNHRIQRFFSSEMKRQMANKVHLSNVAKVSGMTDDVNMVFQLMHMHKHLCTEGLGLRQVIDFYYLLNGTDLSEEEWNKVKSLIRKLHLYKFTEGMMYILHNVLGMDMSRCFLPADEKEGTYILRQIIDGGNFGKYDEKYNDYRNESNHALRFFKLMKLLLGRWRHDPYEISWQPLFYIANWFMIRWYNWWYHLQ